MRQLINDVLLRSLERHRKSYLARVQDVGDDQMVVQPFSESNHPAWILGHLLWVEHRVLDGGFGEKLSFKLDDDWKQTYGIGSAVKPDRAIYKPKAFYISCLEETANKISAVVKDWSDDQLLGENPFESFRKEVPRRIDMLFATATHRAYHAGQLAQWRKVMGLPHVGM